MPKRLWLHRIASDALARAPDANEPGLPFRQQELAHLLEPLLYAVSDHGEDAGQLDFHRYSVVEHGDDTGDGLTHRRDAKAQSVAVPAFAAGAATAGQQVDQLRETGLDATARQASAGSFERGTAGLAQAVQEASQRTAGIVGYVGEWHSHPRGHSASPSRDDLVQLVEISLGMHGDGLPALQLIVGENDFQVLQGQVRP